MAVKSVVREVMTTRVIWVRREAPFREMAAALREHRVSAFPVLDGAGKVIGVVSEADLLAKEVVETEPEGVPAVVTGILHRREAEKARGITAGDLMTSPAVVAHPEDTVEHAAKLMHDRRVKRLPVVDAAGHLVGIISRADVLAVFDRSDSQIRREIIADVLVDAKAFKVAVKDGVVTLQGKPPSSSAGREIVRRIRHVQGVVAVRDRLSYPSAGG